MPAPTPALARLAGALYLVLIVLGVGSGVVREGLVGDTPDATAQALVHGELTLRASALADVGMALADVGLGAVLLVLLWSAGPGLALAATAFRLAQAAVIGLNLALLLAAIPLAHGLPGLEGSQALAALALELHSVGYDLGLFFFGVNSLLTGALLYRAGFPELLASGLAGAGCVYLVGSTLKVMAPALAGPFAVAYLLPLLAELGMAAWLLVRAPVPAVRKAPLDARLLAA